MGDPFIRSYLDDLLRNIRLNVLESRIRPYKMVKLSFLAKEMNINADDLESLLKELILDEKISGSIDEINGYLELSTAEKQSIQQKKNNAIQKWSNSLKVFHNQLLDKIK